MTARHHSRYSRYASPDGYVLRFLHECPGYYLFALVCAERLRALTIIIAVKSTLMAYSAGVAGAFIIAYLSRFSHIQ